MAHVVRKVSNVNSKGKKTFWKLSKKQTWILSGVLAAVVIGVVALVLVLCLNKDTDETENKPDYFLNPTEVSENIDVNFEKSTYAGAKNYAADETLGVNYLFVFAYDSSSFYPVKGQFYYTDSDDNEVDKYVKDHYDLYNKLVELQKEIDKASASSTELAKELKLVVIDTAKGDGLNVLTATATSDNTDNKTVQFVKADSSSQLFVFSFIKEGKFIEKQEIESKEQTISGTGITIMNGAIQQAINYVKQLEVDYKD